MIKGIRVTIAALFAALSQPALAATVVYQINFTAFFAPTNSPYEAQPVSPLTFAGRLEFDRSANVDPTSQGVTVFNFNLPLPVTFAYCQATDTLIIGTNIYQDRGCHSVAGAEDTWFLWAEDAFAPQHDYLGAVQTIAISEEVGGGYFGRHAHTVNFSIRAVGGAVPEPATWMIMILGFGIVGARMRARGGAVALAVE